jgi:hypothetical protein
VGLCRVKVIHHRTRTDIQQSILTVISFYHNAGKSRETAPHAHGSMRNFSLRYAGKGGSRLLGGEGVIPLPLQVPAGPCHHTAKKPPEPTLHAGGSRRNTGHCDAEKRSSRHLEGEGGDPPTPPPSFFPEGITPHPYAGQAGGAPPPLRSRPDSLVRSVAAMSTARAVGSRECHDLILHWPVGRYPDGLIPRFECSTKKRTLTTL